MITYDDVFIKFHSIFSQLGLRTEYLQLYSSISAHRTRRPRTPLQHSVARDIFDWGASCRSSEELQFLLDPVRQVVFYVL